MRNRSIKTNEKFIEDCIVIHKNRYDYSLVNYSGHNNKVKIICKEHGIFEQRACRHISGRGCHACGGSKLLYVDYFVKKAKIIHGDRYDYSKSVYKNAKKEVSIICRIHGEFKQLFHVHLKGHGCQECSKIILAKYNRINPTGWGFKDWTDKATNSKNFDSFKVYIIMCWNESELFFKVGRTFLKTKDRFYGTNNMPYRFYIIKEKTYKTAIEACNDEVKFKSMNNIYKYIPNIKFNGMHECYHSLDARCIF